MPYGETTIVGAVVRTLLNCSLDVIVVTGRDADEVAAACSPARATYNPEFQSGLGSSIAVGARNVPEGHSVLIALGDMPSLTEETVEAVIAAGTGHTIAVPHYLGERDVPGHPVYFGSVFVPQLSALTGDVGARKVIEANRELVVEVPMRGRLRGIETPDDL